MFWIIKHNISYKYSKPVVLEEHTVRLKPRSDTGQKLETYKLVIDPTPAFLTHHNDIENNTLTTMWFEGPHSKLNIQATSRVNIISQNPFNFILTEPSTSHLPISYRDADSYILKQYTSQQESETRLLNEFLKPILDDSQGETIPFLLGLANHISCHFTNTQRKFGNPKKPERTINDHKGACRDFALLYVVACRTVGLAARFVSGYITPFNRDTKPALHAWAEVFLPGAGWLAFDPSYGMAITERHISVAVSFKPANTLPVSGTFRGDNIISSMRTSVSLHQG